MADQAVVHMTGDIVAFIRARLDEDERVAKFVLSGYAEHEASWDVPCTGVVHTGGELIPTADGPFAVHVARHDPARVLRGVEAKRRIVEWHEPLHVTETEFAPRWICKSCDVAMVGSVSPCPTLCTLAAEWADHSGYRAEWTVP